MLRRLRPASVRQPPRALVRLSAVVLALGFVASARAVAAESGSGMEPAFAAEPLQLATVLAEVQKENPQLRAARTRREAAREREPQAAAWDDPRVGVDVERTNRRLLSYNDAEWSISQAIPVGGKIAQRRQAARADVASAEADLAQLRLELEARARTAFYRLANAEARLRSNSRNQSLLRQLAEITRAKYESGRLRQADLLMVETERAKLEEGRVDELLALAAAQTALNALMNRPPQAPLGHAELPAYAPAETSLEDLQRRALALRPVLAAADGRIAAARARVALAERAHIPDPEVRVEARQFNGTAAYNVREYDTGVSISLPWANGAKYRAGIREARRNAEAEQQERRVLETETVGRVRDAWQRLHAYRHHVELFRERLLPLARQTIDAIRTSYESDRATLPEVLTAQRTAQDTETMLNDHLTEYFIAAADLIPLVGTTTPTTPNGGAP